MSEDREDRDREILDLGDAKQVKKRARNARQQENIRNTVLRNLMASAAGRSWMYELLVMCHLYETSFAQNALVMAHREGERNIGLRLAAHITAACPERYIEMVKEAGNDV